MINVHNPESADELQPDAPIAIGQKKTRERIFEVAGSTLELGLDTGEFITKSTVYTAGRIVRLTGKVAKAGYDGVMGHPLDLAA